MVTVPAKLVLHVLAAKYQAYLDAKADLEKYQSDNGHDGEVIYWAEQILRKYEVLEAEVMMTVKCLARHSVRNWDGQDHEFFEDEIYKIPLKLGIALRYSHPTKFEEVTIEDVEVASGDSD